jgi:predicted NBD/HSP70 family sugar kinase
MMPDATAAGAGAIVQDTVSLSALVSRLEGAGRRFSGVEDLDVPDVAGDPVIFEWLHDATRSLLGPLVAVNCLINPDAVLIGGRLPMPLIEALAARLNARLAEVAMPARAGAARRDGARRRRDRRGDHAVSGSRAAVGRHSDPGRTQSLEFHIIIRQFSFSFPPAKTVWEHPLERGVVGGRD